MYREFGYEPSEEVIHDGFLELILGRIYADPERAAQLFWGGLPMGYDLAAVLRDKTELDRAPSKFEPEKADETLLFKLPRGVRAMMRASRTMKRLRPRAKERFEQQALPAYLEYVRAKRSEDLSRLSAAELMTELRSRCGRVLNEFGKESLMPPFFAGQALGLLEAALVRLMGEEEGARYSKLLTMGLEHDTTYEQNLMLSHVAKGKATMAEFVEAYGHRATNEMELSEPRWREDQAFLKQMVEQMRAGGRSLEEVHRDNVHKSAEALRELPARLAQAGGSAFREDIEANLRLARSLLPYREAGKHYLMMGYELIRLAIVELGRRLKLEGDIFYLRMYELDLWETKAEELKTVIARRKVRWKSVQRLDLPDVVDSQHLDKLGLPSEVSAGAELKGDAVAAGVATGLARIVMNPREAGDLGKDYVLVCPSTDPGWTPLFVNARALIVERGGILSHGAIVARDFGIPAVVCPSATTLLKDGEQVRVDGNTGKIARLSA
jgi:pyruvate,water dikinase